MFICMDLGYTFCELRTNYPAIAVIVVRRSNWRRGAMLTWSKMAPHDVDYDDVTSCMVLFNSAHL
jgi:hypothetical protein